MNSSRADHLFWAGLATAGVLYEVSAIRGERWHQTLSDATRDLFHADTKAGRAVFTFAWGGLALWFHHHIIRELSP